MKYACRGFIQEVVEGVVKTQRRIAEEVDNVRYAKFEEVMRSGLVEELERLPLDSFSGYSRLLVERFGDVIEYPVKANYRDCFENTQSGILLRMRKEFTPAEYARELRNVLPGVDAGFHSSRFWLSVFGKSSCYLRVISDGEVKYVELPPGDSGSLIAIAFLSFSVGRPEPFYEVMIDFVSTFMPFDIGDVDLAGYDDVVERCLRIFTYKGVNVMKRHVLLAGPSGCGKSQIAKVVASRCDEYVKLYLSRGDGWQRMVRSLAKMLAGCNKKVLLLVDEIDELGFTRDDASSPVYDLLRLMDGVDDCNNLRILATTNRPMVLDESLLRAGRFGLPILVSEPTEARRQSIVRYYNEKYNGEVDVSKAAQLSGRFTGADLRDAFESCLIMGEEITSESVIRNLDELKEARSAI
jgi:hypothetical protein